MENWGEKMNRLGKVIACFKEVGFKPNVDSFQDKLVMQKAVCLMELLGFDTGYGFSLYVRGPYSPNFTSDLYENKESVRELRTTERLTSEEKELISKIHEISNHFNPTMLEIMATYAFLVKKLNRDYKSALIDLKTLKSYYSEADIAVGVSRMKQLFPPSEKEIQEMKKEFQAWEKASDEDFKY